MSTLNLEVTPLFDRIRDYFNKVRKILILRGGTRSSKTYSILQVIALWLYSGQFATMTEKVKKVTICRKNLSTITNTVQSDFLEILYDTGIYDVIEENKTLKSYTFQGRLVQFIGADEQEKLKGYKSDILYINEANELNYKKQFHQLLMRTKYRIIIDFNPDDEGVRINKELEMKRMLEKKDVLLDVSTYKDNTFLIPEQLEEIEHLQATDQYLRQVYGLGQYGKLQGAIFDNWEIIEEIPSNATYLVHGLDFGFTNDPTGCIGIYKRDGGLLLDEELYRTGLTNQDIDTELTDCGMDKKKAEIIGDCAEPKSIEELFRLKRDIKLAIKGPDSVNYGIQLMKGFKFWVTARSVNLQKELRKYKRKEDKNGTSLNVPIDAFNHLIDAARYGITFKLGTQQPGDYSLLRDALRGK